MRLTSISVTIALALQCTSVIGAVKPRRTSSILINPDAQPDLPTARQASTNAQAAGLNLDDIQGDILVGMNKNQELFFFFGIKDAATFKSKLASGIVPLITSTTQLLDVSKQPVTAVNIAFSQSGLTALGNKDNMVDSLFKQGQLKDAAALGDPGTGHWESAFAGTSIHGVFLIASDTQSNVDDELKNIQTILGSSITEIYRLQGAARPGAEKGHEHFGFMDGIGQPSVNGFSNALPGQATVNPGVILTGETGDNSASSRPAWTKSGSFLAFRQLQQKVPEFNKYLSDNTLAVPGLTQQENTDLLGARMVGRWKSGAPIDLAPLKDDPTLGADASRNNNFNFAHTDNPNFIQSTNQTLCPFAAHIRKSRPRSDFTPENLAIHIMRSGIPYGPEVTDGEAAAQKSDASNERGLAFVSYQSDISNGFAFIQKNWVNNPSFFPGHTPTPGVDPIIGSTNAGKAPGDAARSVNGLNPLSFSTPLVLNTDFVVSRGGEYFFSPPISALTNTLSK